MRLFPALLLLLPTATYAIQIPNFQSFVAAFSISLDDYLPPTFSNNASEAEEHELLKRQYSNTCPEDFNDCANLGVPGLCCASAAICSPDAAGNVACCPTGAVCRGTVTGVITAGTVNGVGSVMHDGPTVVGGVVTTSSFVYAGSTTTTPSALVPANVPSTTISQSPGGYYPSTTTNGGPFVAVGSSTVASPALAARGVEIVRILLLKFLESVRLTVNTASSCQINNSSLGVFADLKQLGREVCMDYWSPAAGINC